VGEEEMMTVEGKSDGEKQLLLLTPLSIGDCEDE
jgi:hypothetical protein